MKLPTCIFLVYRTRLNSRNWTSQDLTEKLLVSYKHVRMVRLKCLSCWTEIDQSLPDVGSNMELSNGFHFFGQVFAEIKWEPRKSNRSEIIIKTYLLSIIVLVLDSKIKIDAHLLAPSRKGMLWLDLFTRFSIL